MMCGTTERERRPRLRARGTEAYRTDEEGHILPDVPDTLRDTPMPPNPIQRLDDDLGRREAVERRRQDPEFKTRLQRIIDQDRELLERLAQ